MASRFSSLVGPSAPRQTATDLAYTAYANVLEARDAAQARRARMVGREVGLPGNTVEADLPGFEAEAENTRNFNLLSNDKFLAGFAADAHNASAVKDDLPPLSDLSALFKLHDDRPGSDFVNQMQRRQQQRGLLNAFNTQPPTPNRYTFANARIPDFQNAPDIFEPGKVGAFEGGYHTAMTAGEETLRGGADFLADAVGQGEAFHNTRVYKSLSDQISVDQAYAQAPMENRNWLSGQIYGATQSLEYMGMALLTKKPILAMGAQQGLQQYGTVRARGGTANEALVSGGVTGAAESLFEKYFGLGWMLGNFGKKATGKFIGGLLLREVPSEMATTAVQDAADALVTGGGGWEQYKKELPGDLLSTAAQTALMVGLMGGPHLIAHRLAPQAQAVQQIEQAGAEGEFLDKLAETAQQSKTKKEDPETLRDFIDQRTEHTPVRNVYVPVEKAVAYMQSEAYKGELDRYEPQIAEAQATQGDVVIPVGEAVAHLAGTPAWDALSNDMRVSPGGLSRNEATQQHEEIIRILEQRGKEIAKEAQDNDVAASDAAQVYDEVKNRLRSGGIEERQADAVAQIYAARYEARAARMGGTAVEQFRASKIAFPGESAEAAGRQFAQPATVNIGLNVFPELGGGTVDVNEAIKALQDQGVEVTHSEVQQSGTEPTLVARLSRALTPEQGHAVSTALKQEAIAQRVGRKGDLFGPAAEKWMPFNPEYFLEPQDRSLNQDAVLLGWQGLSEYLTDEEKDKLREASKEKILSLVESLPHAEEMAAVAQAGRAKRGWYESSAHAILQVFGAADAPRFAALLASLSPQVSVEANLFNALRTWTFWNDAGRPQTRREIVEIMGQAVQGRKGTGSILNAWINNAFAALTADDLVGLKLSGPKVNSFASNLVGAVDEVTNDTWMANYTGLDQRLNGPQQKSSLYKAMSAVTRRAADILSEKTGEAWTPAEVQETVWSFAKTLYETRDKTPDATMRTLLEAGHITHGDIANTPDFAVLFADGIFRTILEQGGYGEQIAALERRGRTADVAGEKSVTQAEGTGFSQGDFQQFLGQAADRLEQVRNRRRMAEALRRGDQRQRELFQDVLPETGWTPERVSGLIDVYSREDGATSAIAVMMSPDEYLGLLANKAGRERIEERITELGYGEFDPRKMSSLPVLVVGNIGGRQQRVMGHDGRHRATMMKQAGIAQIPVVVPLLDQDGRTFWTKEPMAFKDVLGNRSRSSQMENGDQLGNFEGIPISWRYKDQLQDLGERVFYQTPDQIFYSAAERAVQSAPQEKASAAQWKALLTPGRTPGIKSEEIEWTGIHDWLDIQKGQIEKGALLAFIQDHGIKVDEVVLGRPIEEKLADYGYDIADMNDFEHESNLIAEDQNAQFQSYSSDPNNESYRELLITLPLGQGANPTNAPATHWDTESVVAHMRFMDKTDAEGKRVLFIEEVQSDWHQKGRDQGYAVKATPEELEAARKEHIAAKDVEARALRDFVEKVDVLLKAAKAKSVASAIPLKTSEIADLWYDKRKNADSALQRIDFAELDSAGIEPGLYSDAIEAGRTLDRAELQESEIAQRRMNAEGQQGIPEAPFKTSWPALVMKRAIRWAVDHGYDKVAWTTGEEQASRYNLGDVISGLTLDGMQDGEGYRVILNSSAAQVLTQNGMGERIESAGGGNTVLRMTEKQIHEAFGHDLGDRLLASDGEPLSGLDLRVGGEGMKAFYDRNLVNITNDIIKKYGVKVSVQGISGNPEQARLDKEIKNKLGILAIGINSAAEAEQRASEYAAQADAGIGDPMKARAWANRLREAKGLFEARDEAAKGSPHFGFEINDKLRDAASTGFSLFQGERGRTRLTDSGQRIIELFGNADRSTLLHETGHIWLEELVDDFNNPDAPDQVKEDMKTVADWFAKNGAPISDSGFIPTAAHELWARGVERYFMEGKAPSASLRGVFSTFKAWLMRIYGVVQNLQSPITPEIREVFDRLLATDEAIADARGSNATEPLFKTAKDAGMTEAEFADYQKRVGDARDEAYDALLYKTMEKIRREKTVEMRSERASIRDEVAQKVNAEPQFRLLHLLRTGRWLGEPEREATRIKLNTGWLIDNFGEDVLDKLPRGLPIIAGDGETGDTIAEMVGMKSGTEVVHALVGQRAASDALRARGETRSLRDLMIETQVNDIMAQRHGDPLTDGTIEEEAVAALNTARQGEIIAAEARQLGKRKHVLGVPTPYEFAREWARRTVAAGHVRDVASRAALQRYIRASNKAARAAEKAILDGDVDEAYRQKQAQLLNHALLAEAKAAADRIDKIVARMKKLAGRAAMKSVDPDYLDKIHMLLESYDFRDRSQRSIDEQEGFQAWIERQRAQGYEVHIPPRLENRGDPYTRVSVQELESLNDLVESLLALGRTKQKLKIADRERSFAEFRDEVAAHIRQLPDRKLTHTEIIGGIPRKVPNAPINEEQRVVAAFASELLKVETIAEELDGGQTGPLHDVLVLGATTAENKRHELREKILIPIAQMYHQLGRKYWKHLQERVTIPELTWNTLNEGDPRLGDPVTITRSELLAVALNMGNLSNLEKLSKGERWPVETLRKVVNRELTKEDFDFAQQLWDQVEKLWPDIVATEREMSGIVPEKVVNAPLDTPFGTYRGGYWPVVYDPARWQVAEDIEGKEADDMFGLKSGVATQKGHTVTRTQAFGPINLSLERVLFRHLEQVATRIAYASYARDVIRTIRDRTIRGLIDTKLGPEYRKQVEPWLARQIHSGHPFPKGARWWDHLMRQFRINMTVAAMGFRVSTGVAQTFGLAASAQRIGPRWVGTGLLRLAQQPREAARFAYSKSPELLHRTEAVNREVAEVSRRMQQRHKWWTDAQHWAMFHIGMIDRYCVSLPTWLGAYEKGLTTMGMTDEQAVAFADKAVRMSQGTGREKDMSAVQSPNSEAMRFWTMFYTPWNVMFNAQWQAARGIKQGDLRPAMAVTFWWLTVQMLGGALMGGDWPEWMNYDPKDPKSVEDWFARNVFFGLFAGIPLARDAANVANRALAGQYTSDFGETPVSRVGEAVEKAWSAGKRKVKKGENPQHPIKQVADLSAILLGQPLSQPGATGQFLWDLHSGEADPKSVSDWYFGLTTGKVPSDAKDKPEKAPLR